MKAWMPVPGSAKGRLAELALAEFGAKGYEEVSVVGLAAGAGVTTGSLYHHFGSKQGLYDLVRTEIERRLLDRMEGAIAADADDGPSSATRAALGVAFDAALHFGAGRLLSEPHPDRAGDPLEELLARPAPAPGAMHARLLIAAWRAALSAASEDGSARAAREARAALLCLVP